MKINEALLERGLVRILAVTGAVLVAAMYFTGCRESTSTEIEAPSIVVVRTHLPGTLLVDRRGVYWMVVAWPERLRVTADEIARTRLDARHAINMSSLEEMCLRDRGTLWRGRDLWELVRLQTGELIYIDRMRHLRHTAEPWTIQAWRDDPTTAPRFMGTMTDLRANFRDLGQMFLPEGAMLRTERGLFYFFDGASHPFANEDLALAVGHQLAQAVSLTEALRQRYGETRSPLTSEIFATCPTAAANARREDDADGDGVPHDRDCDDDNPARFPGRDEICDGIDNDCDNVVDNGFRVGFPCTVNDSCRSPGVTQCTFDRLSVICENSEAVCD